MSDLTFHKFILIIIIQVMIIKLIRMISNLEVEVDSGIKRLGLKFAMGMGPEVEPIGLKCSIILIFSAIFCAHASVRSLSTLMAFFSGLMLTCSVAMPLSSFRFFTNNLQFSYTLSNSPLSLVFFHKFP